MKKANKQVEKTTRENIIKIPPKIAATNKKHLVELHNYLKNDYGINYFMDLYELGYNHAKEMDRIIDKYVHELNKKVGKTK